MLFRRVHISERRIAHLGTEHEFFVLQYSCGWGVQDHDAREVELAWATHLGQHKVFLDAQMQEIAREF